MRFFKVVVKLGNGRQFFCRVMEISPSRVVLRGDYILPVGMACDLQVIIPSLDEKMPSSSVDLRAEVHEVIFSEGYIHLECRIKSLSNEAGKLLAA